MTRVQPRELAYCGVLGAAALLLPTVFHLVRLGPLFMPMYLPLMLLAFYVRPLPAAVTALVTPLLSGAVTGMPPFYPPVAPTMALELAVTAALLSGARRRWPRGKPWVVLASALVFGRVLHVALVYGCARVLDLPAGFLAGLSLLAGWPGIVLMMAVIPVVVRGEARRRDVQSQPGQTGDEPRTTRTTRTGRVRVSSPKWQRNSFDVEKES